MLTSLCDLWMLEPRRGWQLIYSCSRDRQILHAAGIVESNPMMPMSASSFHAHNGPSASLLSTAWVQMMVQQQQQQPGLGSDEEATLWLFGGVTDCPLAIPPRCIDDPQGLVTSGGTSGCDWFRNNPHFTCDHDLSEMYPQVPPGSTGFKTCPAACGVCSPSPTAVGGEDASDERMAMRSLPLSNQMLMLNATGQAEGAAGAGGAGAGRTARRTVCDSAWASAELRQDDDDDDDISTVACSSELWAFSTRTLEWTREQQQPDSDDADADAAADAAATAGATAAGGGGSWPAGRCGAYHTGGGGGGGSRKEKSGASSLLLSGGWRGAAAGECEAPPAGQALPSGFRTLEPRRDGSSADPDDASDGDGSLENFWADWLRRAPRGAPGTEYMTHGDAACYAGTDAWRWVEPK
jgi:hypothetical protein